MGYDPDSMNRGRGIYVTGSLSSYYDSDDYATDTSLAVVPTLAHPDASASYNSGAMQETLNLAGTSTHRVRVLWPRGGTYNIDAELTLPVTGISMNGVGGFKTRINQTTSNRAIFTIPTDNTSYLSITDLDLSWSTNQSTSNTSSYGIAITIAGSTTQGVYGLRLDRVRITGAYRGFGIRKSSGGATLWNVDIGSLVIIDSSQNAVYWHNPSGVGQPENRALNIYVQNPTVTPAGAALDLQNVELSAQSIGIEDWTGTGILTAGREPVNIDLLHVERHHFTATNQRLLDNTTGLLSIRSMAMQATCAVGGGNDAYVWVPAGPAQLGHLDTNITNTSGTLSLWAAGTGPIYGPRTWIKTAGTVGDYPSWDSTAPTLLADFPGRDYVVRLADGVAAPNAIVGQVQIYVDSSSGDLKCVFGDGTVKTIVVDT